MNTMRMVQIGLTSFAMIASANELRNEEKESFLLQAKIVRTELLSMGITNSSKASLDNGTMQHDAHMQKIDERKGTFQGTRGTEINFRDSYKFNVAAYELAKLLGLNMVPPSVERKAGGTTVAATWWVDDVAMTELARHKKKISPPNAADWQKQMNVVHVFDQLIYNTDRNLGNLVITNDWQIWMIDHTRAFRLYTTCPNMKMLRQVDRKLLQSMRELTKQDVTTRLGKYLSDMEIDGLMARRDRIVQFFDNRIAGEGEAAVVYELARR